MLTWKAGLILPVAEALKVRSIATEAIDRTLALLAQTRSTLESLPAGECSRDELLANVIQAQQSALALRQERLDQLSEQLHCDDLLGLGQVRARLEALFASFSSAASWYADFWHSHIQDETTVYGGHAFLRSLAGRDRATTLNECQRISVTSNTTRVQTRSRASRTRQIAPVGAPPTSCYA